MGRYSFIGVRPRKIVRWSLGDEGDPYAIAEQEVKAYRQAPLTDGPPFAGGAVGPLRLRPRPHRRAARRPEPGRRRPPRPRAHAERHPRGLRPPPAHAHDHRERVSGGRDRARATRTRSRRSRRPGGCSPGRCPTSASASRASMRSFESNMPREQFEGMVVAHRRVRPRRRHLPGRPVPAVVGGARHRPVQPVPRAAHGEPEPVHVLPGLRRLPDRRARARSRCSPSRGRRASTRPIAGTRPRGATPDDDLRIADELLADPKERAEHVMLVDLGRNDLGPRLRVRHRLGRHVHGRRDVLARPAHRLQRLRHAARGRRRDGRAALDPPGGHAVRRAEGPRDADHRRAGAREARRLRRRDRLALLRGRPRHLHLHPHRRGEGRRRAHPGRRRHRRRREARVRVRGVAREGERHAARRRARRGAAHSGREGPRRRQLRLLHLQPRPDAGGAGGGARRRAQRPRGGRRPARRASRTASS